MKYTYPINVEEAVKLLDAAVPGWYNRINLDSLDMGEASTCILGQLYRNYNAGIRELFGSNHLYQHAADRIFGTYASLASWKEWIKSRKLKDFGTPTTTIRKTVGKKSKDKLAKFEAALTKKAKTVTLIKRKRKQLERLQADIDKLMATL